MRSWWLSPASGAGFAPPAARGAWWKVPLTWSSTSFLQCRCASGWSFPIPLRILFAAHAQLLTPVLQVIHRAIASFLMALGQPLKQTGVKRSEAHTGAVSLIQRFGSAANLNIHLHCLVLDGVYRSGGEGVPVFHEARAPSIEELHRVLAKIITRLMRLLTRQGHLIEELVGRKSKTPSDE